MNALAAEAIADLDAAIDATGQDVVLVRLAGDAPEIRKPSRAFVRGYRPDDSGGLLQGESMVVLSPTHLPAEFAEAKATRLRATDKVEIDGRVRPVMVVEPLRVAGDLVRLNVVVKG